MSLPASRCKLHREVETRWCSGYCNLCYVPARPYCVDSCRWAGAAVREGGFVCLVAGGVVGLSIRECGGAAVRVLEEVMQSPGLLERSGVCEWSLGRIWGRLA